MESERYDVQGRTPRHPDREAQSYLVFLCS